MVDVANLKVGEAVRFVKSNTRPSDHHMLGKVFIYDGTGDKLRGFKGVDEAGASTKGPYFFNYDQLELATDIRVGDKVRGKLGLNLGGDSTVAGKVFRVASVAPNFMGEAALLLDSIQGSGWWFSRRFDLVAHDEPDAPAPAEGTPIIDIEHERRACRKAREERDAALAERDRLVKEKEVIQKAADTYGADNVRLKGDLDATNAICDRHLDRLVTLEKSREEIAKQLGMEQEQVLRLKLALAERPLPTPPASVLEKTAARVKTEVAYLASVWWTVFVLAPWAWFVVAPAKMAGRGTKAFGRFWAGQWERSWFSAHTWQEDQYFLSGRASDYPWHELFIGDPLRLLTLALPVLVLWGVATLVTNTVFVWSEEKNYMTAPIAPDPSALKERAWVEQRAARLQAAHPHVKHRRVS